MADQDFEGGRFMIGMKTIACSLKTAAAFSCHVAQTHGMKVTDG
jgi:hypothetical protein